MDYDEVEVVGCSCNDSVCGCFDCSCTVCTDGEEEEEYVYGGAND